MIKILVAEDERDIRDLIAFTLKFAGYEIITANNGEEAVQFTKKELPDLVITDVRMPKMTGYEACKQIKADPATSHIPVVFLSAKGQESEVQTGLELGGRRVPAQTIRPRPAHPQGSRHPGGGQAQILLIVPFLSLRACCSSS